MSLTTRHKYQSENKLAIKDAQYTEDSKRTMKRAGVNIYRGNSGLLSNGFQTTCAVPNRQHKEVADSLSIRSCVEFA